MPDSFPHTTPLWVDQRRFLFSVLHKAEPGKYRRTRKKSAGRASQFLLPGGPLNGRRLALPRMAGKEEFMFERILIPLDGSPRAEMILPQVSRILDREDSEVMLLRVIDLPPAIGNVSMKAVIAQEREAAQNYIHAVSLRCKERAAKVHGRIAEGPVAETILQTARTEGATMIAMSTHGRSGILRWALGSVAEKVARASHLPVFLVRSFRRSPQGDLEPLVPQELPFRRILVPVDGSPTSLAVVSSAENFALLYGSEITVLHVQPPPVAIGPMFPGMEAALPAVMPSPVTSEQDEVTGPAAKRFEQAGLQVSRASVMGEPAAEILDYSSQHEMDLIAIGTHGRSGAARWALGSVAERVLHSAERPLLLVRMPVPQKARKGGRNALSPLRG